jgi:hypothetical protein
MDMILKRSAFRSDGIFSGLMDDHGNMLFQCLEHAYRQNNGDWLPKIPDGVYQCIRGMHRLDGMAEDFETFEIIGILGHFGILFHVGNFDFDSDGCILVGSEINKTPSIWTLLRSKIAFDNFMNLHANDQTFSLVVSSN